MHYELLITLYMILHFLCDTQYIRQYDHPCRTFQTSTPTVMLDIKQLCRENLAVQILLLVRYQDILERLPKKSRDIEVVIYYIWSYIQKMHMHKRALLLTNDSTVARICSFLCSKDINFTLDLFDLFEAKSISVS